MANVDARFTRFRGKPVCFIYTIPSRGTLTVIMMMEKCDHGTAHLASLSSGSMTICLHHR